MKKNTSHFTYGHLYQTIFMILFLFCFAYLIAYLNINFPFLLNSDDSSELILSHILSDGFSPVTNQWFYSTELRFLNTQLVFSFFFKLLNNWHLVRIASTIFMIVIMILSLYFLLSEINLKKYFFPAATILILPFSSEYFNFVLKGAYYIPHITISFTSIALLLKSIKAKKNKAYVYMISLFLLSFLAGLGGPRQVIITNIPMLLSACFFVFFDTYIQKDKSKNNLSANHTSLFVTTKKHHKFVIVSLISFVFSLFGFFINTKVLSQLFDFKVYNTTFDTFSFNDIETLFNSFIVDQGYIKNNVISFSLFNNIVCLIWIVVFLISIVLVVKKHSNNFVLFYFITFTIISYISFGILIIFTNQGLANRYSLPVIILSIPCTMIFFELINHKKNYLFLYLFLILLVLGSLFNYNRIIDNETNSELIRINNVLINNGYLNGYATFWNANVITELSNGEIEVWDWGDTNVDFGCIDQTYKWLQRKSHITNHPQGKVFWILNETQNQNFHFTKNVSKSHLIYETPSEINWDQLDSAKKITRYYVYGFDSYDEMYSLVGNYNFTDIKPIQKDDTFLTNKVTIYPDEYTVIIYGSSLSDCDIKLTYNATVKYNHEFTIWSRPLEIPMQNITHTDECIVLHFYISDVANNFQVNITNNDYEEAIVNYVKLTKKYIYYANLYDAKYTKNCTNLQGTRIMYPNSYFYGPYISLPPGTYILECEGENLSHLTYDATCNSAENQFTTRELQKNENNLSYEITIDNYSEKCEFRFYNFSEQIIKINDIRVSLKLD